MPGLRFCPFRCVRCHKLLKVLDAIDVPVDETFMIKAFIQNFVNHRKVERIIGSRANLHKAGCLGGGYVGTNIDHGHFAAVFHCIHQIVDFLHIDGLKYIPELKDHVFGVL